MPMSSFAIAFQHSFSCRVFIACFIINFASVSQQHARRSVFNASIRQLMRDSESEEALA